MKERAVEKARVGGLRVEMKVLQTPGGHIDGLTQLGTLKKNIVAFRESD